jgi:hypothetical protein
MVERNVVADELARPAFARHRVSARRGADSHFVQGEALL